MSAARAIVSILTSIRDINLLSDAMGFDHAHTIGLSFGQL
ncbi:hypothetical protein IMCC12053_2532 [Celeribacter marinus]|uniref:Uncharacterized protein n=1 Tax=Celeribacter marinus TaxID=1397108 RepID=A0A0N9ZRQ4_9RHOB|nr:hypothetical protein IMCC12053_2532 [Celeribacter marinus]